MRSESSGFEQNPCDVVLEIPESERGAAEVFESAVDRLAWSVAGAGPVEVAEHVSSALFQHAGELADLDELIWDAGADPFDRLLEEEPAQSSVLFSIRRGHVLVHAPCRFDMSVVGVQRVQPGLLLVGEQGPRAR